MWTSHQPFVIPIRVVNFEDPSFAKANQSKNVQKADAILNRIKKEIIDEVEEPRHRSIHAKFLQVERSGYGDTGRKAVELYRRLNGNERQYLAQGNHIPE